MNKEEIKEFLPHREPMLLLDEVVVEDEKAIGKYTVKGDEFFLQGHFPGNPIVPGVIQCEMIAQTAVALLPDCKGKTPLYTGLNFPNRHSGAKRAYFAPAACGGRTVFTAAIVKTA